MNKKIQCILCNRGFPISEAQERYYLLKGMHEPKRCPRCREKVKRGEIERNPSSYGNATSQNTKGKRKYNTKCFACGIETTVYHRPTYMNPAFCEGCGMGMRR